MNRLDDVTRFYSTLSDLERKIGGARTLRDCTGKILWPSRGVYFFLDTSEQRSDSGTGPRVVRVGTHALKEGSKAKFWQRLSQHRGTAQGGNHRGSIFRLLIGDALKAKNNNPEPKCWGIGSDPSSAGTKVGMSRAEVIACERELEFSVTRHICSLPFLWLAIEDDAGPNSMRAYVERNSIALLSNYDREAVDQASDTWLGRYSLRERVRRSGLWNNNYVDQKHSPDFLDRFEQLITLKEVSV